MKLKSHRQFVQEQIETQPELAAEYKKAQIAARFAVALAMLRETQGLTQQQLAEATGLKQPMLARYENGQIPTVPTLQRLAGALEVRVLIAPDAITFEPIARTRKSARRTEKV